MRAMQREASSLKCQFGVQAMEQSALKNVNNCLNTNICCNLETSGLVVKVLIYIQMLFIFSTPVLIRHQW
jgi:hypothetical protein